MAPVLKGFGAKAVSGGSALFASESPPMVLLMSAKPFFCALSLYLLSSVERVAKLFCPPLGLQLRLEAPEQP